MENNTTAELFWCRAKEWFLNMADRMVYTDDSKETVDIINLLLLGWILLGLIVYILGNIIATQLQKRKSKEVPAAGSETSPPTCPEKASPPKPDESVSAPVVSERKEDIKEELAENIPKLTAIPECIGGEAETVRWVNDVFSWIYTQGIVSPILNAWLSTLNIITRMPSTEVTEHGVLISFKDITPGSQPPLITDMVACDDDRRDEVIQCQVDAQTLGFEIAVTKEENTFPCVLTVQTLSGKLCIEYLPENLLFIAKFEERPQLKFQIAEDSLKMFPAEDRSVIQDIIYDIATDAITSAVVQVCFSSYTECPRMNSYKTPSESGTLELLSEKSEGKLLVKVIRAENLGSNKGCSKPYCVVEMDDPLQRFETSDVEHDNSPVWDESFVFDVNGQNAELLFEIYDKGRKPDENFLGLCMVSVEEVLRNASQQQTIPLEACPIKTRKNDTVTGSITLEFDVLGNDKHIGDGHITRNGEIVKPGKVVETNSRITAGGTVITTTTIKRTTEG